MSMSMFDEAPKCAACGDTGWVKYPQGGMGSCRKCGNTGFKSLGAVCGAMSFAALNDVTTNDEGPKTTNPGRVHPVPVIIPERLNEEEYAVAVIVRQHGLEDPVKIKDITEATGYDERKVKGICRTLRDYHLLPIGASRKQPAGIYWITTEAGFLNYYHTTKAQALSELGTLGRLARKHFPDLAGQLKFDF